MVIARDRRSGVSRSIPRWFHPTPGATLSEPDAHLAAAGTRSSMGRRRYVRRGCRVLDDPINTCHDSTSTESIRRCRSKTLPGPVRDFITGCWPTVWCATCWTELTALSDDLR